MSKRSPSKMGPRNIQFWKGPAQKFTPQNFGQRKTGTGGKRVK